MENLSKEERTRQLLLKHCQSYPLLKLQDLFKYIYQSSYGCEHMVSSESNALSYILEEYESAWRENGRPLTEELDGPYSRVSLAYMDKGLSAKTLSRLFLLSSKHEEDGLAELKFKLNVLKNLIDEGSLPFSTEHFSGETVRWEADGFPALHHSDSFRENYKPSYRVIAKDYVTYLELFTEIDRRLAAKENGKQEDRQSGSQGNRLIVSIEGGSASGKSTLGHMLETVYGCTLFHMDDYFLQPEQRTSERLAEVGGNLDRERFLEEVLLPLSRGENSIYFRKFDCSEMALGQMEKVEPKKLIIVEGAYSMHPELAGFYDFSLFLDIDPEKQKSRINHRNSPEMAERFYTEWIPMENAYFSKMDIKNRCHIVIPV